MLIIMELDKDRGIKPIGCCDSWADFHAWRRQEENRQKEVMVIPSTYFAPGEEALRMVGWQ